MRNLYGRWFSFLPALRGFLLDTVYPESAVCRACGRVSRGGVLCPDCASRLRADGTLFAWDREDLEEDLHAYSLRPHTGVARSLVIRLKHQAEKCLAEELAQILLPLPPYVSFSPDTVVTWVPMPESRRRNRGIDHGRALAEAAARQLNLPCRPLLSRRETRQKTQASLGQQARAANLKDAFFPRENISFPVLLVDDVLTTGTTARRCAAALRSAGAVQITVLTFTRAVSGR
jgi:ComF family protein